MAKRLSETQREEIISGFLNGNSVNSLSEKFGCTNLTIIRNLKKKLGYEKYNEVIKKSKLLVDNVQKKDLVIKKSNEEIKIEGGESFVPNSKLRGEEVFYQNQFVEISPLTQVIDDAEHKDISSKPLSEINFPKVVFLIVKKEIELETKLIRDYPEWQFLPEDDLNRKTIEIYFDLKTAKQNCTKEQKVIKVPNTDVFRIVKPILLSRGISRIITEDNLIAL